MKRLLCLLLLMMMPCAALADEMLPALYQAMIAKDTRLRKEPADDAKRLGLVASGESVLIHRWGEEWCLCSYGGEAGWLPTERLYEIFALSDAQVPNFQPLAGLAIMTAQAHAAVADYGGNTLLPGDRVALLSEDGSLMMMRGVTALPADSFDYLPFIEPGASEPGDLLYACTTYYNDETGGALAQGRQYNIELAVQRLNGMILRPGERFSYNAVCAPYNKANGYVKAPNISRSGVGVSGGVCQVSTTMYGVVLGLGLDIEEWHVHRASGVAYAPVNFDCAVATWKDFVFVNSLDIPLQMEIVTQRGALTVLFFHAEKEGDGEVR